MEWSYLNHLKRMKWTNSIQLENKWIIIIIELINS